MKKWKREKRRVVYSSNNLQVYEDTVKLPNNAVIDDYSVIKKNDIVIIVAINDKSEIMTLVEYKYAANIYLNTLPAGNVKSSEDVLESAKRELLEETGYGAENWEFVAELLEYPSKDLHKVTVYLAQKLKKIAQAELEQTEQIDRIRFVGFDEIKKEMADGKWLTTSMISALSLSFLKKTNL